MSTQAEHHSAWYSNQGYQQYDTDSAVLFERLDFTSRPYKYY